MFTEPPRSFRTAGFNFDIAYLTVVGAPRGSQGERLERGHQTSWDTIVTLEHHPRFRRGEESSPAARHRHTRTTPALATLANGGWIVVWASNKSTSRDIYGRIYEPDGSALGFDFVVNKLNSGAQTAPSVAGFPDGTALSSGGWVATWTSMDTDIFSPHLYRIQYSHRSSDTLVNALTNGIQKQSCSFSAFGDGGYLVAYATRTDAFGDNYDAVARRFGPNCLLSTGEIVLASHRESSETRLNPLSPASRTSYSAATRPSTSRSATKYCRVGFRLFGTDDKSTGGPTGNPFF